MDAAFKAFKEGAKKEGQNFNLLTDSEHWFCVSFPTREHKDEFLKKLGLTVYGDKYLDGTKVAAKLGISLETPAPEFSRPRKSSRWADLAASSSDMLSETEDRGRNPGLPGDE